VDAAYTTGNRLKVYGFSIPDIGGKLVGVTIAPATLTGTASTALFSLVWLKGKSISFTGGTIKLFTAGGGTINISNLAAPAGSFTTTGVLFFYDTDDHLLKMYGVKVVNKTAGVADSTIDTVAKLTEKTIAQFTTNHDPAATDIVIF